MCIVDCIYGYHWNIQRRQLIDVQRRICFTFMSDDTEYHIYHRFGAAKSHRAYSCQFMTMTSHESHVVSGYLSFDCLCNILCKPTSQKHQSPHCWPFVRGVFPAQEASNVGKSFHVRICSPLPFIRISFVSAVTNKISGETLELFLCHSNHTAYFIHFKQKVTTLLTSRHPWSMWKPLAIRLQ